MSKMQKADLSSLQQLKHELEQKEAGPNAVPNVPYEDMTPTQQLNFLRSKHRAKIQKGQDKLNNRN